MFLPATRTTFVADTGNISENLQKHFLCPRDTQQCCHILPWTGNITRTMLLPQCVLVLPGLQTDKVTVIQGLHWSSQLQYIPIKRNNFLSSSKNCSVPEQSHVRLQQFTFEEMGICSLTLTLSLPRVINFKFPLQPHQKYNTV